MCGCIVAEDSVDLHKYFIHNGIRHYGLMWPLEVDLDMKRDLWPIINHESDVIADFLGVSKVYIRDEGMNFSGSMKDYSVEMAVKFGCESGYESFFIVSSGNHAVSLAKYATKAGVQAVVFTPATSSKIGMLSSMDNVFVVGVKEAIFEDVYSLVAGMNLDGFYNANVSNEFLLSGFSPIADQIANLNPAPTHILAGAGNGSYLAGIFLALNGLTVAFPKIVPVGMAGAFPVEEAFKAQNYLQEYNEFRVDEHEVDAAEGSIAIASYSMPQLMHAVYSSDGFPLGGLFNEDLGLAYELLARDKTLISGGVVPEPTGIMGLAAAIKHKERFSKKDVLLISFTGHGVKDVDGVRRVAPGLVELLTNAAITKRPDLIVQEHEIKEDKILFVDKAISPGNLKLLIKKMIEGDFNG
jgi:threonine synthase